MNEIREQCHENRYKLRCMYTRRRLKFDSNLLVDITQDSSPRYIQIQQARWPNGRASDFGFHNL